MTAQSRATNKASFNTTDKPTEAQFADLCDSFVMSNIVQGGAGSIAIDNLVRITAANYAALAVKDTNTLYALVG